MLKVSVLKLCVLTALYLHEGTDRVGISRYHVSGSVCDRFSSLHSGALNIGIRKWNIQYYYSEGLESLKMN